MAIYKVPQDVEAEDKLLGPFSFRQFIYLGIVVAAGFVAYILFRIFPILAILPLPIMIFFGAIALPLRKDQPMETYLLAVVRFYLKPKRRLWDPDGTINYVEITAPKVTEGATVQGLTQETAEQRLDYLARIMDSRGWAVKGVVKPSESVTTTVANEVATAPDIMDDHADLAKSFDDLLARKHEQNREQARNLMQRAQQQPKPQQQAQTTTALAADDNGVASPHYDPYPSSMHQKVINPNGPAASPQPPASTSTQETNKKAEDTSTSAMTATVSPDIMRLASNNDLSISAIAHEAHRLQEGDEGEVVISLH